jgi:cytoskeletal protein RodZ
MDDEQGTFQTLNGDAKIGPVLEKTRQEKGLTLDQVEQVTKIRKRYLAGLEREDFGALPDAVYARGFLKTYANFLGLDGEELARELKDRRKPRRERGLDYGAPEKSDFDQPLINPGELPSTEGRRKGVSAATVVTSLFALLVLAVVVGTLYYVGRGVQVSGETPAPSPPSKAVAANGPKRQAGGEETPQEEKAQKGEASSGKTHRSAAKGGAARQPQPDTLKVQVSVEGSASWLSILADGNLAYEQIAQPGFSQTFEAQREISIRTGNAGAVGVTVNGQNLGKLGDNGEVLTREFTLKSAT